PGQKKIQVIKAIKEITGKGLKECKELVDKLPATIKENVGPDEAATLKEKLEEAGADVELQQ
ncbi:MAG TPA: ribosomal protein L7/L12, partial [Candidatus Acetothermia bacterium]|nr:ribosomal protein L7/L12 [Candidatus Acetothermia bacterium]HEX32597.1 ribosomal protein L7/L12 [Candidatus Acetothermia bacterium]